MYSGTLGSFTLLERIGGRTEINRYDGTHPNQVTSIRNGIDKLSSDKA